MSRFFSIYAEFNLREVCDAHIDAAITVFNDTHGAESTTRFDKFVIVESTHEQGANSSERLEHDLRELIRDYGAHEAVRVSIDDADFDYPYTYWIGTKAQILEKLIEQYDEKIKDLHDTYVNILQDLKKWQDDDFVYSEGW